MKYLPVPLLVIAVAVCFTSFSSAQSGPEFRLGFKALADLIPAIAGQPVENEHYASNGDSLQQTTTGLMVWRKADNWTAFTNGSWTWVNGPNGVQRRMNRERFPWESDGSASTAVAAMPGRDIVGGDVLSGAFALTSPSGLEIVAITAEKADSYDCNPADCGSTPRGYVVRWVRGVVLRNEAGYSYLQLFGVVAGEAQRGALVWVREDSYRVLTEADYCYGAEERTSARTALPGGVLGKMTRFDKLWFINSRVVRFEGTGTDARVWVSIGDNRPAIFLSGYPSTGWADTGFQRYLEYLPLDCKVQQGDAMVVIPMEFLGLSEPQVVEQLQSVTEFKNAQAYLVR